MNRDALADLSDMIPSICRSRYEAENLDARLAGDVGRMLRTRREQRHAWRLVIWSAQRRQGRAFAAKSS